MNTVEKNEKAANGEMPEGAEWLELDVAHLAELADYVERQARDDEERVRGLQRLLERVDDLGARQHAPEQVALGPRLAFFHRMGIYDPYEQVPSPAALRELILRQDPSFWNLRSDNVCAAHVMWVHLRELLVDRIGQLQEGLALLGREVIATSSPSHPTSQEIPHFDLLTDDMALDIICRGLVADGYLHPETREAEFRFVCKGTGRQPSGPLVWTGKKNEFKLMVTTLFAGQPRMWERATACFEHVSGPFGKNARHTHLPLGDDSARLLRRLNV